MSRLLARGEPVDGVLQALASGLAHKKMMQGTLRALHEVDDPLQREALSRTAQRLWLRQDNAAPHEAA